MAMITSFTLAALAAVTAAAPVEQQNKTAVIPLKYNQIQSIKDVISRDKARVAERNHESGRPRPLVSSGPATNVEGSYTVSVAIGSGTYDLIVDTGSSNTWCGSRGACEPNSGGQDTGNTVSVGYGSGSFSGEEYIDTVSYAGLTVSGQSIGAASQSTNFDSVDGIIGFGPVDLTQGTVSNTGTVPTFMDNLYSQGSISQEVLGVYFHPESGSDTGDTNGELTLGGVDSSKYSGDLFYFPSPGPYWGISIAGFSYGSQDLGGSANGIVDTGTTLILLPDSVYNSFLSATGGTTGPSGLPTFSTAPTETLTFNINGVAFQLPPFVYLVPEAQYSAFGLQQGQYYAWIGDAGTGTFDATIGQKFLEYYYSVFDTNNQQVGLAVAA